MMKKTLVLVDCGGFSVGLSAILCFLCGLLDFIWCNPAFPREADPDEATEDSSGLYRISRYLTLFLSVLYVVLCGAAYFSIYFGLNKWRKQVLQVSLYVGALLFGLAVVSNRLAGSRRYASLTWQGPHWFYTLPIFLVAVLLNGWAYLQTPSSTNPDSDYDHYKLMLHHLPSSSPSSVAATKEKKDNPCQKLWQWIQTMWQKFHEWVVKEIKFIIPGLLGTIFIVGLGLILTGIGFVFYVREPAVSMLGSLDADHNSFLEWHHAGGSAHLLTDEMVVEWGADVGLKVLDLTTEKDSNIIFQTTSPNEAFIISSLISDAQNTTIHAVDSGGEAGLFKIIDRPGRLSTEQVVEFVSIDHSKNAITFTGYLYYGPVTQNLEEKHISPHPWRTFFKFELSARKETEHGSIVMDFKIDLEGNQNDRVYFIGSSMKTESIFGLGESFSYMDLKGGVFPIITREQGIGRGLEPLSFFLNLFVSTGPSGTASQTTYSAIPHIMTSNMRSFYSIGTEFMVFDFSRPDRIAIEVNASSVSGGIISAASPTQLISTYVNTVSGVMRPLPAWTGEGAIVGLQGGKEVVMKKLQALLDADVPIAAIWLQDWAGKRIDTFGQRLYWNWQVNEEWYPNWFEWIEELYDKYRINVMTYINPYLATGSTLFQQADGSGCLLKREDEVLIQSSGSPEFKFGTVNLFDEKCMAWYISIIQQNMLGTGRGVTNETHRAGVMGWMADFGESLPFDIGPSHMHNELPVLWAETNRRAVESSGNPFLAKNVVFFTRSAALKSPSFTTLQWMGDQLTSWDSNDGLHSAMIAQLSAGLSGLAYTHSDIGGFTMINKGPFRFSRDEELLKRWIEYSTFADSVFRSHEGLLPDAAAQVYDESVVGFFAKFARLHKKLWRIREMVQITSPGFPIMQSMWIHYPDDPNTFSLKTQFLFGGPKVLVCPTLRPGTNVTSCYLPSNETYTHLFTGETFHAYKQFVKCPSPLGSPCVLFTGDEDKLGFERED